MERSTTNGDTDSLPKIPDNVIIALVSSPIEQINEKVAVNAIESSFVVDENRTPLQKELSVVDQTSKDVHDKVFSL